MKLGIGLNFGAPLITDQLAANYDLTLSDPITNSDEMNAAYTAAAGGHSFIIDFEIPEGAALPSSYESLFYYGLNNSTSNYFWVRREGAGGIEVQLRRAGSGQVNLPWGVEMIYPSKRMRLGFSISESGDFILYMNGRWLATSSGKNIPNYAAATTRLYVNSAAPGYTNAAGSFVKRLRYYGKPLKASQLRLLTNVNIGELGLSYSKIENSIGFVGAGQSLMQGSEEVVNKSIMPQVAAGNLFNLNPSGLVEAFQESWYAVRGATAAIVPYTGPASGDTTPNAGYMGRVGNDFAALTGKKVVVANAARSSTKISTLWAGARTDLNVGSGATTASGFLTWTTFERLRQMNAVVKELRLIDDQGQGDAVDGMTQANYETQKHAQLDLWKSEFPSLHFYIVGLTKWVGANVTSSESNWNAINAARAAVAASREDCTFIDISDIEPDDSDGVHLLNAGQETIGAIIANAVYAREYAA